MDGEVIEYAARNVDGVLQIRSSGEADPLYPAEQWAPVAERALGSRVFRRRVIVLEDWAEVGSQ